MVQQWNQFANDGQVAGLHQRGIQEGALHVARTRSIFQTGNEPEKEAVGEDPCFVFTRLQEVGGDEPKIFVLCWKNQINFFVGRVMTANTLL